MLAACTGTPAPATQPPPTTAAPPVTTVPATVPETTVVETTTTVPRSQPEITDRPISNEELVFMVPDPEALGGQYETFEVSLLAFESNEEVVRQAVLDPRDEEEDITTYGRTAGARSSLHPRHVRIGTGGLTGVQTWVSLFNTPEGASAYLEDFVRDAAKGVGGGHPSDLAISAAEDFVVDEVGQEATGLILAEGRPGAKPYVYETLVVFRIERLLGFATVVAPDDEDRRVRAVTLAKALEDRMVGVITGEIPLPEPPPERLAAEAYEFTYEQLIRKGSSRASIRTQGVRIGTDAAQCSLEVGFDGFDTHREYIITDDRAWLDDADAEEPGWERVPLDGFGVQSDLIYCPGWAVSTDESGLDKLLESYPAAETDLDGIATLTYQLDQEAAFSIGLLGDDSKVVVDLFELTVDTEQPWIRGIALELSGSRSAFASEFGNDFRTGSGRVRVTITASAGRFNDPELEVTAPAA